MEARLCPPPRMGVGGRPWRDLLTQALVLCFPPCAVISSAAAWPWAPCHLLRPRAPARWRPNTTTHSRTPAHTHAHAPVLLGWEEAPVCSGGGVGCALLPAGKQPGVPGVPRCRPLTFTYLLIQRHLPYSVLSAGPDTCTSLGVGICYYFVVQIILWPAELCQCGRKCVSVCVCARPCVWVSVHVHVCASTCVSVCAWVQVRVRVCGCGVCACTLSLPGTDLSCFSPLLRVSSSSPAASLQPSFAEKFSFPPL